MAARLGAAVVNPAMGRQSRGVLGGVSAFAFQAGPSNRFPLQLKSSHFVPVPTRSPLKGLFYSRAEKWTIRRPWI